MKAHHPDLIGRVFEDIARTRMAGLPFLHPDLRVETIGFERDASPSPADPGWLGTLVTPWCMNLLWWPDDAQAAAPVGCTRTHRFGDDDYGFIGAHEPLLGGFEMCSLFSPMHAFANAQAAREVALSALAALRQARASVHLEAPSRRAFLRGRA